MSRTARIDGQEPIEEAAVFLLRVVLHDWPNDLARRILFHLREAATPDTKLLIADFVLPLACPDNVGSTEGGKGSGLEEVEGAESILAPSPLLANLGKASANVYWMDMTMQVMFNAQERTLRETVALARSAGWKVVKVTKATGSLFGHIFAVPVGIPPETIEEQNILVVPSIDGFGASSPSPPAEGELSRPGPSNFSMLKDRREEMEQSVKAKQYRRDMEMAGRASSRCGTPTFGSRMRLSSVDEALSRFGGGVGRSRGTSRNISTPFGSTFGRPPPPPPSLLKPALSLSSSLNLAAESIRTSFISCEEVFFGVESGG
ncbi:hypothetical protein NLJ89_g11938 [Agrocybe chaxingu]|uniref:O-methyltransferase domain-containing protein n=1 Tax=Agrocybe chaxingu TaxID=84603 RepID=A0A9W8MML4_9AGAR|nr:hypothetical protein NLJ89_g11938 [Agrocybe chaxingu]